jgi:hypothetical protein
MWIPFVLLGICLSGCTLKHFGVFVNSTSQPRVVILLDRQETKVLKHCVVNPGEATRMETRVGVLKTFDISGSLPVRRELSLLDPKRKYSDVGETVTFYLLTETGIYPIPKVFRTNWTNHLEEITKQ